MINITDEPVNKITKIVISPQPKEGFIFNRNAMVSSMTPLPMIEFPGPDDKNLTGLNVDRLTVMGFSVLKGSGTGAKGRWVVRCACGRYEIRSSRALKRRRTRGKVESCHECDRTIETREGRR